MTLREGNREYFFSKLDEHFPGLKKVYQKKYGYDYMITSENNDALMKLVHETCSKHGIVYNTGAIFEYMRAFKEKKNEQIDLF